MTKTEIIISIKNKFDFVGIETQGATEILSSGKEITNWSVIVFDLIDTNVLVRKFIHFYIDESNNAYWVNKEPKLVNEETFVEKVNTFIKLKIEDETIDYAVIISINEEFKKAEVEAIINGTKKNALIVANELNEFSITVLI